MSVRDILLAIGMLALATPLWGQTAPTADAAMARYRAMTSVVPKPCAQSTAENEIIVCANTRLRESQRVPYIEETRVGDRPRLAPGEVPSASGVGATPCPPRGCPCPPSECGIGAIIRKLRGE